MRIAIMTMVYNEKVNLPIWLRHYKSHCPDATLFVLDHASDDGSTQEAAGAHIIPIPRDEFDERNRAGCIADFQRALLRYYDVFIYTDCDEMLVADPDRYRSLTDFLRACPSAVIAPTALNVLQIRGIDPPIDLGAPILGQRRHVRYSSGMCKPTITRQPVRWDAGFHWCDQIADYRSDCFMFHLRRMDLATTLARLQITRGLQWSEHSLANRFGVGHRQTNEERIRDVSEEPARQLQAFGTAPFTFEAAIKKHYESLRLEGGIYRGDWFDGPITTIPDRFRGLI